MACPVKPSAFVEADNLSAPGALRDEHKQTNASRDMRLKL
jgi:hypothetical protein